MTKEQALKVIRKTCEKAQKNGLINSLDKSFEVISAIELVATNLVRYEQQLTNFNEQNEAYKKTNNELIAENEKVKKENEELKKHIEFNKSKEKLENAELENAELENRKTCVSEGFNDLEEKLKGVNEYKKCKNENIP
jgi:predicted nuclease with TOPRIM domain